MGDSAAGEAHVLSVQPTSMEPALIVPRTPFKKKVSAVDVSSTSTITSHTKDGDHGKSSGKDSMPIVSPVREYIRNRAMSAPLDQAGSGRKNKQPHKVAFLRTTRRWASPSQGPSAIRAKSLRLHASSDKENSSSTKSPMVKTPLGNGINGKKLLLSSGKRSMSARSAIRDGTPSSARRRRPSPLTRNKGTQTEQVQQRKSRSGSTTSSCSSPVAQEMPLAEAASFSMGHSRRRKN